MLRDGRRDGMACDTECPFVGTTAAILIGAGIAAGTQVAGAAIQSKQVGKAVNAQKEAAAQAQAQLKPFQQVGTQAFTTLGGLMGLGGGGGGAAPGGLQYDPAISPGQANFAGYSTQGGYLGKDVPMSERMSNPLANVDAAGYTAQQHGASPTSSSYGAGAPQGGGGMVQVRAPNGSVYQVPVEKVGEAQQNGGTVVGRA